MQLKVQYKREIYQIPGEKATEFLAETKIVAVGLEGATSPFIDVQFSGECHQK